MPTNQDLSKKHQLISDLFKWPVKSSDWEPYKLSNEQLDFFKEFGYLSGVKLLDEWQIDRLHKELEEIVDPKHPLNGLFHEFHSNESVDPDSVLFHALGAWRITEGFHDVIWNPAFAMAASQILGNKAVRFWHDQLFCKPARHGGVVAWHQDYSYWTRTGPMQHLTCWVGLDDASTENGCLYYVPKSHNWGLLDKPDLAGDMEGLMQYLTEEQKAEFKPVPIELKKGHATFHHPLMVHGSFPNKSPCSRSAFVLNVFTDGTKSNTDEILLKGVPPIKAGQQMEGQFFPLIFSPDIPI
ncbi:Phytanoyl-CoA dioxygenase (PhyH) [Pedobacter steynii]|uniref:Phytanoyl-CoA dioxygenase (PhyH) n=1 Tax=Pedobacter steynii TaxID=430522 RepID=A0A1H0G2B2_9SPHI|nr:phytanoyl-CoA dioxygenase family protein [Pedobacter steynii]NQX42299.1 phytanoyl-CoA dioxygenase family protein [Pedobacter steynii]SDO01026.1 Phytanoyl-CoA dioxygenase (PhyH) [Pedobacter steynii]